MSPSMVSLRKLVIVLCLALLPAVTLSNRLLGAESPPTFAPVKAELLRPRDGLGNVIAKLQAGQPVRIAYLGGSITAAAGWRVQTREWFSQRFSQAKIEEIDAAIGGTGSDLGVFRVDWDALRHKPDLLFVEFAVNDGGASAERIWQAMEGIVRQTWAANPQTDICFVYTYCVGQENDLREGLCPRAASAMEILADHYGIPSINFALKVVELQRAGKLVFKSDEPTEAGVIRFSQDGVHPLTEGHRIYTQLVAEAVENLEWLAKHVGSGIHISVMSQYTPLHRALQTPGWDRRVTADEYAVLVEAAGDLGFENGWIQEFEGEAPADLLGQNMPAGEGAVGAGSNTPA